MLGGGVQDRGSARRVREGRRRRRRTAVALTAAALLAAAAFLGRRFLLPPEVAPEPSAATSPAPERAAPAAPAAPSEPAAPTAGTEESLPPLAESDAFVRARAAGASARPEFAAWLAGEGLVTRFVAAVDAVANGETPRSELPELVPHEPFRAAERGEKRFASAVS